MCASIYPEELASSPQLSQKTSYFIVYFKYMHIYLYIYFCYVSPLCNDNIKNDHKFRCLIYVHISYNDYCIFCISGP